MNLPPWSAELASIPPVRRDANHDRGTPSEPEVLHPPRDLFAVRVEIIADRRRIVNAPPVYVAPLVHAPAPQPELPQAPRLGAGEAAQDGAAESRAAPPLLPAEAAESGPSESFEAHRALAAYGAQVELGRRDGAPASRLDIRA